MKWCIGENCPKSKNMDSKTQNSIRFGSLFILLVAAFIMDLALGSVHIPIGHIIASLGGHGHDQALDYIVMGFRLPKAITAVLAGSAIALSGLNMQALFKNPLADTSILGIGHGASLGVALFVLAAALLPGSLPASVQYSNWGIIAAAVTGALLVLLCISAVSVWLDDMVSLLIVGLMIGFATGAVVNVLQYFSDPELIKNYLIWTFGSLSGVTWSQLRVMSPVIVFGLAAAAFLPKSMNAFLLGENYAASVGLNVSHVRFALVAVTSLLAGTITAFTGPIAFVGIAVPYFARIYFHTSDHKILIPATMLSGAVLMLICDIISQLPGGQTTLPINAVTSLIGAPVVVFIILKSRRTKRLFS